MGRFTLNVVLKELQVKQGADELHILRLSKYMFYKSIFLSDFKRLCVLSHQLTNYTKISHYLVMHCTELVKKLWKHTLVHCSEIEKASLESEVEERSLRFQAQLSSFGTLFLRSNYSHLHHPSLQLKKVVLKKQIFDNLFNPFSYIHKSLNLC